MLQLVTDTQTAEAKSRIIGIQLALLTLRLRNNWTKWLGDPDTAAIVLAVVAIKSERLVRSELDTDLETLAMPMPPVALASCNISSIAAATGLNRETTRRKVENLVKTGMLINEEGSISLAPGFTQRDTAMTMVKTQLDEVRRTANDLLRVGALAITE
jgi:hypothetical protein